jgi:hypothetical protein
MERAFINSHKSLPSAACWPERGVSAERNRVAPKPRRYGTMMRQLAAIGGMTASKQRGS